MTATDRTLGDATGTDVIHPDWDAILRYKIKILWIILGVLALCIFAAARGKVLPIDALLFLAAVLALFGVAWRRAIRNQSILIVGPDGVAFPANRTETIPWTAVTRVRLVRRSARGIRIVAIRFEFAPETLRRPQFGSFRRDRYEVILSIGSIAGRAWSVKGGIDRVTESVARFHRVER